MCSANIPRQENLLCMVRAPLLAWHSHRRPMGARHLPYQVAVLVFRPGKQNMPELPRCQQQSTPDHVLHEYCREAEHLTTQKGAP